MKICISCEKDIEGKNAVPIKEDRIIRTIRSIKKMLRMAKMNELYVCESCVQKHTERRKTFEKHMLFGSVFAGVVIVIMVGAMLFTGKLDLWAFLSAFIVAGVILCLPIFKYAPAIDGSINPAQSAEPPKPKKTPKRVIKKKMR